MYTTFHFLNVGKGNCTIIDFPSNRLSVIDIDDSRNVNKLDYNLKVIYEKVSSLTNPTEYILYYFPNKDIFRFILTHPDMDHMSGIKTLFDNKLAYNFWDTENKKNIDPNSWKDSPYDKNDWDYYQLIRKQESSPKALKMHGGISSSCCWVQDGISILSPDDELIKYSEEKDDYDHLSMVLSVEYINKRALLPGDATLKSWINILKSYSSYLKSDILLAPNHGSDNHICKELLDLINPKLIIISVEVGVDYSNVYKNYNGLVLSTKHYGNILVSIGDDGTIYFKTECKDYSNNWYRL